MTSPLLPYANAYLLAKTESVPTLVNGRIITEVSKCYLIQCYLKRQQSTGTNTGADSSRSNLMPGVSGDAYLYRGYALRYGEVLSTYELDDAIPEITWIELTSTTKPNWFVEGVKCEHKQGSEQIKHSKIERSTGVYGGTMIDELLSHEIVGVPIVVTSGDVIN